MTLNKYFGFSLAIGAFLLSGSAFASSWPTSVVGSWAAYANDSPLALTVQTQGTVGACVTIAGTLADTAAGGQTNPIQGFYCPTTGRISFLRKTASNNDTFQVYIGNLNAVSRTSRVLRMGGTFAEHDQVGALGEYNFWAQK